MKKNLLAILFLLASVLSFSQLSSKEYADLLTKARALRNEKKYKEAANTYSLALRNGRGLVTNSNRWSSACFWMDASLPDSAYMQLDIIASSPNLSFDFIIELITDDDCFLTLHNDKHWKDFKRKISKIPGRAVEEYVVAIGFVKINDYDSAFYHLNIAAESKDLTLENAYGIISNNFLTGFEKEKLEKDKRWAEIISKIFTKLNKKYIPESAFTNAKKTPKRILIDGGHYNLHDIKGTYSPLAGTLRPSGFEVSGYEGKFDEASLKNIDILIITNPHPDRTDSINQRIRRSGEPPRWAAAATLSAYTEVEVSVIEKWVKNGGSFLLILDHAPFGQVGRLLTAAFGIENRFASTYDPLSRDPAVDTTAAITILFTRSKGLIGKHPIMNGVDSITTYTGESMIGPPVSDVLLHLPSTATDLDWLPETKQFRNRSAAGRSQAVAFEYGKGRVVMLGEAAITRPSGLSVEDRGNWKFILNILRWLAREKMN